MKLPTKLKESNEKQAHDNGWRPGSEATVGYVIVRNVNVAVLARNCLNCMFWGANRNSHHGDKEICTYEGFNQRPPATVIVKGCQQHFDELEIPF